MSHTHRKHPSKVAKITGRERAAREQIEEFERRAELESLRAAVGPRTPAPAEPEESAA